MKEAPAKLETGASPTVSRPAAFNRVRRHFAEAHAEDSLRFLQLAKFREH